MKVNSAFASLYVFVALAMFLSDTAAALAQEGPGPRPVRKDSVADEETEETTERTARQPAEPAVEPEPEAAEADGDTLIRRAYAMTSGAKLPDELTQVIELCEQGLAAGASPENSEYGRKLMAWSHNRRGELYAADGREEDAFAEFSLAASLDPNLWRAVHNRGVSYAQMGKQKEALADFNRTLQLNSNYSNAWFNRGELRYEQGDFVGAIQDYTQAVRLRPRDAGAYNSRGHAYYRLGRTREAMTDYDQAVRLNPKDAAILTNRGDAYAHQGLYAQAAQDFREAIKLNDQLGRAYQSAAWLMSTCPDARFRNAQLGLESARKAIELDGENDFRYLETLAAAMANNSMFDEALEAQAKVAAIAPETETARAQRRIELYKAGRAYREGGARTQQARQLRYR